MELTFDGQQLVAEVPPTVAKWVEDYVSLDSFLPYGSWSGLEPYRCGDFSDATDSNYRTRPYPSRYGGLEVPPFTRCPKLKLNQLYWPTGISRWGMGYFLCDETALGSMSQSGTFRASAGGVTISGTLYILNARKLSAVANGNNLWLLCLVDDRFFHHTKLETRYQVGDTWADVLDASAFGITLNAESVAAGYLTPEVMERSTQGTLYGGLARFDAWAACVGQRITKTLAGAYNTMRAGTAATTHTSNLGGTYGIIAGGELDPWPRYPLTVDVVFPAGHRTSSNTVSGLDSAYVKSTTRSPALNCLGSLGIHTTAWAAEHDGTPSNQSELDTLAGLIAADVFAWSIQQHDYTFAGIKSWTPTGFDDFILYQLGGCGRQSEQGPAAWTRVVSHPPNMFPRQMAHRSTKQADTHLARWIDFTLGASMDTSTASATATVDAYDHGESPSGSVTVYNFPLASGYMFDAANGAKGKARWVPERARYEVYQVECG